MDIMKAVGPLLGQIAPTIATALGGPLAGGGLIGGQHGGRATGIKMGVRRCGVDDGGQVQHFPARLLVKVQVQLPQSPGSGLQILQMRNEGRTRTGAGAVVHHPRGLALVELRGHGDQGCDANATRDQDHRGRALDQRKVVARRVHLDRVTGFELLMDPTRAAPALRVFLHRHPITVGITRRIQQRVTAGQALGQHQVDVGPGTGRGQRRQVGGTQVVGVDTFGLPGDRFDKKIKHRNKHNKPAPDTGRGQIKTTVDGGLFSPL